MKYFVISDLHGCYTLFKKSLRKSGYSKSNPNHTLVVLGDIFDRGEESRKIYEFLKDIPQDRVVLVRGNHDYLLFQALDRDHPEDIDFSNGTVLTACQMAYISKTAVKRKYQTIADLEWTLYFSDSICVRLKKVWKTISKRAKASDMYKWFSSSQWVNYWETDKFIGVHSFVPVEALGEQNYREKMCNIYHGKTEKFAVNSEWRTASPEDWEIATWGCPYVYMDAGLFPDREKTLICGHYRTDAFHHHYDGEPIKENFDIYYSDKIIAIDGLVHYSGLANVLVIDENGNCFDQSGAKLI